MTPHLAATAEAWRIAELRLYSACDHCDHQARPNGRACCGNPAVVGRSGPQPVELVRNRQGACGPEAVFMAAPWLHS